MSDLEITADPEPGFNALTRQCLMVVALALGIPLTIAWVGFLGLMSFDAVAWLLDRAMS